MIYEYQCDECNHMFDVIKSYKEIDNVENCALCGKEARRCVPSRQAVDSTAAADWNNKDYNPAFGKAVTPMEAKKIAKKNNWTEVGTEPADKIHKHFKAQRDKKEKDRWDKLNTNLGEIK